MNSVKSFTCRSFFPAALPLTAEVTVLLEWVLYRQYLQQQPFFLPFCHLTQNCKSSTPFQNIEKKMHR